MTFKQFVVMREGTNDEVGNLVRRLRREWATGRGISECKCLATLFEHLVNTSLSPYSTAAVYDLWNEYQTYKKRAA